MTLRVSLVSTTFQEARSAVDFLESIRRQTRSPDEVIIADAGSTDGTVQIIESFQEKMPVALVVVQGANRSRGRNAAIERAKGDVIACADAGCRLDEHWLETIVAPLEEGADAVAGYYQPDARGLLEQAVAAATIPAADEVNAATFLPSSRSIAFRKWVWDAAGRYPEHLSHNEDTAFAIALRRVTSPPAGGMVFQPRALVYWRPRGSLSGVFVQFFRYALGDGQCGLWFPHYTKAYLLAAVGLGLLAAGFANRAGWFGLAALAACYEIRYALRSRRRGAGPLAAAVGGVVMAMVDAAHVLGYLPGRASALFWRVR